MSLLVRSAAVVSGIFLSLGSFAAAGGGSAWDEKIDPELARLASALHPKAHVAIVAILKAQPGSPIAQEVGERYEPALREVSQRIRLAVRLSLPAGGLTPDQERVFARRLRLEPPQAALPLLQELDTLRDEMIAVISVRTQNAVRPDHDRARNAFRRHGGTVRATTAVLNAAAGTLPAGAIEALARDDSFAYLALDRPGYPELNISAPSLGAPSFWNNGYTGGTFDCGVLDTGVQQNHPAFAGHRFESNAGTTDSNGHGTAMAGIMASVDATNRGIAWGLDTICVAIAGSDSTSMSGMHYLMTGTVERPENVNYSFGNGTANTVDYGNIDRFFDGVCDTFSVMVSKSTGNGGWGTTTITHPAPAYNLLANANMNDFNTLDRTDDRINSSSSRGPTLGGRKKPDIAAPGTNIVCPNRTGGFSAVTGTSPAAPHTGGSIILLNNRGTIDPIACKAVLLNNTDAINDNNTSTTADDFWVNGSHWNKSYGWGYLNLARAFLHATDVFVRTFQAPPPGGRRFLLLKGAMFAGEKATVVWNRHVAYNGAAYPTIVEDLSNLDLGAWRESGNLLLAQSTSAIDNVEQISVSATEGVVLKVWTVGPFDPQVPSERFAVATEENFVEAAGPVFQVGFQFIGDYAPGSIAPVQVDVKNIGDLMGHGVEVSFGGLAVVGPNPVNVGTLAPGQTKSHIFFVQTPSNSAEILVSSSVSSSSYGESFTGFGSTGMIIG